MNVVLITFRMVKIVKLIQILLKNQHQVMERQGKWIKENRIKGD